MNEIKYENKDKSKLYYIKDLSTKKKTKNYMFVVLVVLLLLGATLILSSIGKIDAIGNSEVGSVDYTVYLKDNDFYTNKFLKKGDSEANNYIASLIDKFDVNFVYNNSYSRVLDYEYEIKKLEKQAAQLARNEFVEKVYALSVKHQIPIENVMETISFLNELKADPAKCNEKIRVIREHFRTTNNAAGLKWIDAIERWLKQT